MNFCLLYMNNTNCNLESLPKELLIVISENIDKKSTLNLRSVNKTINNKLWPFLQFEIEKEKIKNNKPTINQKRKADEYFTDFTKKKIKINGKAPKKIISVNGKNYII